MYGDHNTLRTGHLGIRVDINGTSLQGKVQVYISLETVGATMIVSY
jgi:hypothetical protein